MKSSDGALLCFACGYLVGGDRYAETSLSAAECDTYLRVLAELIGGVPQYRSRETLVGGVDEEARLLLRLFARRLPWSKNYHVRHGGWLPALIAAGVLPASSKRRIMGVTTTAEDGHECASLGELHLDNWLHANGIPHTREPRYPKSNMRADFAVGDVLVEFLGLTGLAEYDAIVEEKRRLARKHQIKLVCIYPEDLENWGRRAKQIGRKLGYTETTASHPPRSASQILEIFDRHGIDPSRWPHHVPATRLDPPRSWQPDPYGVGATRLRVGDFWTRRIRDAGGRELRHTPGVAPVERARLTLLWCKDYHAFDDKMIAASNSLHDFAEAGRTPDYRTLWPLLDAEQSASILEGHDLRGDATLTTALFWAHKYGDGSAALAIVDELDQLPKAQIGDFEAMVRGSLPRHGFEPDPVAAGLATER